MTEIELVKRLEKLERDNRRLKGFAAAALVLLTAFTVVYATRPAPWTIKAHEFEVVDYSGKVRARMGSDLWGTGVRVYDGRGLLRVYLNYGSGTPSLALYDAQGKIGAQIAAQENDAPVLWLHDTKSHSDVTMGAFSSGPNISLGDAQGFRMDLGSAQTVASIVMFGNDKKHRVIWRAP